VSLACGDVVPHIVVQSPRPRLGEFETHAAKRLLQHYLPQADSARAVCSHITRPPTEAVSLVERQNNFRGGYLDRSNVTILRVTEKQSLMQNLQPPFQTEIDCDQKHDGEH
jgi:hypothetical protein